MQDDFEHLPLAPVLQQWAQQLAASTKKDDAAPKAVTAKQGTANVRKKSKKNAPASVLSPTPLSEDESLFLQAMGSLVTTPDAASQIVLQKGYVVPKAAHKTQKTRASLASAFYAEKVQGEYAQSQGPFPLHEREGFSQIFSPIAQKAPKKTKKSKKYEEQGTCESLSTLTTTAPKQDAGKSLTMHEPSMQELLQAQEASALGHDGEGMDAFFKAMKEVEPLAGKGRDIAPEVQPSALAAQGHEAFASMMEKKLEFALALKGEYIEGHVVGLDELTMNNLRAGIYSPEAHLDLHGLNAEQAYQALTGFFKSSWYKGMRTLLLIPGRGKNSPNGVSVLREKVQLWLTQDPFKRVVLAFCTAQPVDGGPGTVYVLLRKYKKKGKICWERMPSDPDLY